MVFQELLLLDHLSAFDNTALPLRIAGRKPRRATASDVAELLAWVGLGHRMHAMPPPWRAARSSAWPSPAPWSTAREILLADEPTGNVDHEMALRIYRLFVELNRLGTTVIIATHDQDLVARSRPAGAAPREAGRLTRPRGRRP